MIRYLQEQEKQWSRALWEEAFREDSASFLDYYFREVVKHNRIPAQVDDNLVQAMIHLNPYELWVRGRLWKSEYLVGVATREELRGQGCMRRLMLRVLKDLYAEGMPFCFLMPADEAIYRPFGFTYIARKPRRESAGTDVLRRRLLSGDGLPCDRQAGADAKLLDELSTWMNGWLRRHYQLFALRQQKYLERLLWELASEDGTLDVFYDGEKIVGMESIWGLEEREQRFLYGDAPYVRELPPAEPIIMARILKLSEFVKAIRLREEVEEKELIIPLQVEDELLAENAGAWIWRLNHETSWLERGTPGESGAAHGTDFGTNGKDRAGGCGRPLALRIEELAEWLFGYGLPQGAEAYGEYVDVIKGVLLDEVV